MYSPLTVGQHRGSVSFVNEKAGEFWYDLALVAEAIPPVQLEDLSAPVSGEATVVITLDNPSDRPVVVQSQCSNDINFTFQPEVLAIPAYGGLDVRVTYVPTSMGEWESATLSFSHPALGDWIYLVRGMGTKPSTMPTVAVSTPINTSETASITFHNPFQSKLNVRVDLSVHPGDEGVFRLISKKRTWAVGPLATVKIPFTFFPTLIHDHLAIITLASTDEDGLVWTFPLKGVSEGSPASTRATSLIRCRARACAEETVSLSLDGLPLGTLVKPETFSVSLECGTENDAFINRALTAELLNPVLTNGSTPLQVKLVFEPLKSRTVDAFLVINKKSGGRWRFPLAVIADDCDVDDVITIDAAINTASTVGFSLFNHIDAAAAFKASFTLDSPLEFKVRPSQGMLEPASSQRGQQFAVTFAPKEYGKKFLGHLIIETDEMQWKYQIRGANPKYVPPAGESSLDNSVPEVLLKSQARQMRKAERYTVKMEELKASGRR
jgi:hypothetical protein